MIIAVANQKGGTGKTTTSICLAQELKAKGKKCLIIDSDSQCNTTNFYGAKIDGEATLADILFGDADCSECIQKTEYMDVIPSDYILSDAENRVPNDEMRFIRLKKAIKKIKGDYDYIIIDTPPNIGVTLKNVLNAADTIIIPIDEAGWAVNGLMDLLKSINLAKINNEDLKIDGIVITKTKPNTRKSGRIKEAAEIIAEKMGTKVYKTRIRESVNCTEALTEYGVPLDTYAPKSTTRQDYTKLAEEILNGKEAI